MKKVQCIAVIADLLCTKQIVGINYFKPAAINMDYRQSCVGHSI